MKNIELLESLTLHQKIDPFFTSLKPEIDNDGKFIFCCSGSYQIKIISIETGKQEKVVPEYQETEIRDEILSFKLTNKNVDGCSYLITGHQSGLIKQWKWEENPALLTRTWKGNHNGPISKIEFDQLSSTLLATGGADSIIKVWDIQKQFCTHHFKGTSGVISAITFHPSADFNGSYYLFGSGDHDYNICVWNLIKSKLVTKLIGHASTVISLVVIQNGTQLLSGSRDKLVILWDLKTLTIVKSIPIFESIESLLVIPPAFYPKFINKKLEKDQAFLTVGEQGKIKFWDLNSGNNIFSQEQDVLKNQNERNEPSQMITAASFCQTRSELMISTYECNILFYKLHDLRLVRQFAGYNDDVLDIKFLGTNQEHIAVATNSPNIKVFDLKTMNCSIIKGHADIVLSLEVFPSDPYLMISSSKDNSVRLWKFNPENMEATCCFYGSGHSHSVTSLGVPSSTITWFISGSEDKTIKIWNVPEITNNSGNSPTALQTKQALHAHEKDINSINISPNDKLLCTGSQDRTAKIWSIEEGLTQVGVLRGHKRGIWCVQFSRVDKVVCTASADSTIKIWNIFDTSCLKTFQGHDCSVLKISFIRKGMQIISSSSDGNIKIWSVKENECLKTIDAHEDKTWALAVSKNEDYIITGAADSVISIWKDITSDEKQAAIEKQEQFLQSEQTLLNYLQQSKWTKALKLAIKLEQPFRVLNIIKEILLSTNEEKDSNIKNELESVILSLREDQLITILEYAIKWNTNAKHCKVAQTILNIAFKKFSPQELMKFPQIKTIVEGFLPYSERHLNRFNRMSQQATFIEFVWKNIKLSTISSINDENLSEVNNELKQHYPTTRFGDVEDLEGSKYVEENVSETEESD